MKSIKELAAWLYDRRLRGFHGKNMQKCEDEAEDIIAFLTSQPKEKKITNLLKDREFNIKTF